MLVRFAPRQRQKPMNELLSSSQGNAELDLTGSLIDADMGAYYSWLNQQRLAGAEQSAFLVWFEGHSQALVISERCRPLFHPERSRGICSSADLSREYFFDREIQRSLRLNRLFRGCKRYST